MRYDFTDFRLDTDARELRRGKDAVHLSPKALDLLIMLITERPRAVPKRELYDRLWPSTFVVDANLPVLMREVRGALGDRDREIIRTVHGTGYAFAAAVRETDAWRWRERLRWRCLHCRVCLFQRACEKVREARNLTRRGVEREMLFPILNLDFQKIFEKMQG